MSKKEQLQNGLSNFLQVPKQSAKSEPMTSGQNAETFTKHNLFFSDVLFEKIKILQMRSGKTQREVLDTIIRQYVEEYEKKNGELVPMTFEL
jgi:hypothetical protein